MHRPLARPAGRGLDPDRQAADPHVGPRQRLRPWRTVRGPSLRSKHYVTKVEHWASRYLLWCALLWDGLPGRYCVVFPRSERYVQRPTLSPADVANPDGIARLLL